MTTPDFGRCYRCTKDSPPWPLLIRAATLAPADGRALDLGAGAGGDTRYLLERGFGVTAVDADPRAVALLAALPQERLRIVQSSFEDFPFETYDLISAQFALPFMRAGEPPRPTALPADACGAGAALSARRALRARHPRVGPAGD